MKEHWIPWGKKSDQHSSDCVQIHPLLDHMMDVAAVLEALLQLPGISRALERVAGRPLSDVDCARLAVLAFLHDIGKANTGFQVRYWNKRTERPAAWSVCECGHGPQGWALFRGSLHGAERVTAGLPLEAMDTWGEAVIPLLFASISHHGRPVDECATFSIWQPIREGATCIYDPAETVAAMGACVQTLYPLAFTSDAPDLPNSSAFAHLFAGLVQLADWLGSDSRPGFFPYSEPGEDRAATAPQRAAGCPAHAGIGPPAPSAAQSG